MPSRSARKDPATKQKHRKQRNRGSHRPGDEVVEPGVRRRKRPERDSRHQGEQRRNPGNCEAGFENHRHNAT